MIKKRNINNYRIMEIHFYDIVAIRRILDFYVIRVKIIAITIYRSDFVLNVE